MPDPRYIYASAEASGFFTFCAGTLVSREPPPAGPGAIIGAVLGSFFGCCCLVGVVVALFFVLRRYKNEYKNIVFRQATDPLNAVKTLKNIHVDQVIGKGNFGVVYKGTCTIFSFF